MWGFSFLETVPETRTCSLASSPRSRQSKSDAWQSSVRLSTAWGGPMSRVPAGAPTPKPLWWTLERGWPQHGWPKVDFFWGGGAKREIRAANLYAQLPPPLPSAINGSFSYSP